MLLFRIKIWICDVGAKMKRYAANIDAQYKYFYRLPSSTDMYVHRLSDAKLEQTRQCPIQKTRRTVRFHSHKMTTVAVLLASSSCVTFSNTDCEEVIAKTITRLTFSVNKVSIAHSLPFFIFIKRNKNQDIMLCNIVITLLALGSVANVVSQTVVDLIVADSELSTLGSAVITAGLGEFLSGPGPFTVFAPTNEAFETVDPTILNQLLYTRIQPAFTKSSCLPCG